VQEAGEVALVPEDKECPPTAAEGVVDHLTVAEEEDRAETGRAEAVALREIRTPQYSWEILPILLANKRSGRCLQARAYSR